MIICIWFVFIISSNGYSAVHFFEDSSTALKSRNGIKFFNSTPTSRPTYLNKLALSTEETLIILAFTPETNLNVFAKTTQADWNRLFFGSKPSIKDYFFENSYGKLHLSPAEEGSYDQNNGVAGWYILPNTLSWYKSNYADEAEYFGIIAKDALLASNAEVNYSRFDDNGDGFISSHELHIYIIIACYDESYLSPPEPRLWRVHFNLVDENEGWNIPLELDGKTIGDESHSGGISLSAELLHKYNDENNVLIRVGSIVHEFGHDLGLQEHYIHPDHADKWCAMGAGDVYVNDANYPNHICAVHKEQLGWVNPIIVQSDQTRSLLQIELNGDCLKLWENGNPDQEYFLIENRNNQVEGNYDSSLPSSGLLIWHVDKRVAAINATQGIVLEQADNESVNGVGNSGDTYKSGKEFLANTSIPNSRSNPPDDDITGISVSNISAAGEKMSAEFNVSHSASSISLSAKPNFVTPNGNLVSSISAYLLDAWGDTVESAHNQIYFSIKQGQEKGALNGTNPSNSYCGIASIGFSAGVSPGSVIIEAMSPGCLGDEEKVFISNLGNNNIRFDGLDDIAEINDNSEPNSYTIEAWIRVLEVKDSNIIVRTGSNGPHNNWSHQLRIRNNRFEHYLSDGQSQELSGTTEIEKGNLYHIAAVASNNSLMKLFVNGEEEGEPHSIATMERGLNRLLLGSSTGRRSGQGSGIGYFNGIVEELRISTNTRYMKDFLPSPKPFSEDEFTCGLYHFDEGFGQTISNSVKGLGQCMLGSNQLEDEQDPVWYDSFRLMPPCVLSPSPGSVEIGHMNFIWRSENNVKNYHLQISSDMAFTEITWEDLMIQNSVTEYDFAGPLPNPDSEYYWRLRYKDYNNNLSDWSEPRRFKLLKEIESSFLFAEYFSLGASEWCLNGDAAFEQNNILLVPNKQGQGGSAFFKEPFRLYTFEATLSAYFGENQNGADGLCFVWQANSPEALGVKGPNDGSSIGYGGIENSFAIEFDTWQNPEIDDPSNNHVGFNLNGNLKSVITNSELNVIEDNKWHDIRIRFENQYLYLWIDGRNYLDYKIENYDFSKSYYFGASAATGAAVNNHRIDNFILKGHVMTDVSGSALLTSRSVHDFNIINFPNPFNKSTIIEFSLPVKKQVVIKLYNILGQEKCILMNSTKDAGKYQIKWNTTDYSISAGIYLLEISTGDQIIRKKMTVLNSNQ